MCVLLYHVRFHSFPPFNFQEVRLFATGAPGRPEPRRESTVNAAKGFLFYDAAADYVKPKGARRSCNSRPVIARELKETAEFADDSAVKGHEFFAPVADNRTGLFKEYFLAYFCRSRNQQSLVHALNPPHH